MRQLGLCSMAYQVTTTAGLYAIPTFGARTSPAQLLPSKIMLKSEKASKEVRRLDPTCRQQQPRPLITLCKPGESQFQGFKYSIIFFILLEADCTFLNTNKPLAPPSPELKFLNNGGWTDQTGLLAPGQHLVTELSHSNDQKSLPTLPVDATMNVPHHLSPTESLIHMILLL